MKKQLLTIIAVAALTLTACSTTESIGNFVNSGCGPKSVTKTRSASDNWPKDWPEAVLRLTKVGNDLQCEARNIMVGCGKDVSVDCNQGEKKLDILLKESSSSDINVNCVCFVNLYFTIFDGVQDEFDLSFRGKNLGHVAFGNENTVAYSFKTEEMAYGDHAYEARLEVFNYEVEMDSTRIAPSDSVSCLDTKSRLEMGLDRKMSTINGRLIDFWVPCDTRNIGIQAYIDSDGSLVIAPSYDGKDKSSLLPVNISFLIQNVPVDGYHLKVNPHKVTDEHGQESFVCDYEGDIVFEPMKSDGIVIKW
jgi:predicted small secreted protein